MLSRISRYLGIYPVWIRENYHTRFKALLKIGDKNMVPISLLKLNMVMHVRPFAKIYNPHYSINVIKLIVIDIIIKNYIIIQTIINPVN